MHRTALSVGALLVAVATVAGGTAALFTGTAESQGNTFQTASMSLALTTSDNGSNPEGQKSGVWNFSGMMPGGDEKGASLWLRNTGDGPGESLDIGVDFPGGSNNEQNQLARQMRVTELNYDGESLLEGGAGADLASYEAPQACDVTVHNNDQDGATPADIQTAVDNAGSGDTVCVAPGSGYSGTITIGTEDVTVAALTNPVSNDPVELDGQFKIQADGVEVAGFKISNTGNSGEQQGIFVGQKGGFVNTSDSISIHHNLIDGVKSTSKITVEGIHVKHYNASNRVKGVTIEDNVIRNVISDDSGANGMKLQANIEDITVAHNTIAGIDGAWTYGITATYSSNENGYPRSVVIEDNDFTITDSDYVAAVGVDDADASEITLRRNNLDVNGFGAVNINPNQDQNPNSTLDAQNNWWGDFNPADDVEGDVDTGNYAYAPFAGQIAGDPNGNGYADLHDLKAAGVSNITPGLEPFTSNDDDREFEVAVQLDGSTGNQFQNKTLNNVTFNFTLNQIENQ
jgi:hypothetical protein